MKKNKVEIALQVLRDWHDEEVGNARSTMSLLRMKSLRTIIYFADSRLSSKGSSGGYQPIKDETLSIPPQGESGMPKL